MATDPIIRRVFPDPDETSDVRLVPDFTWTPTGRPVESEPTRSHWQRRRDEDLDQIEEALRTSRDLLSDAIEGMESRGITPAEKGLETRIGHLIEQVIEYRRVRL